MTLPSGGYPSGSINKPDGTGISAHSQKTQAQWKAEQTGAMSSSYEGNYWAKMVSNMFGGFLGGIGMFISQFFAGIFGGGSGGGGFLDLVGGFLGVKNDVKQVREVEVPRLDNRIDNIEVGGGASAQRASFFQDGTWTKPAGYTRHVVKIIGGASGGGRGVGSNGAEGGYAGGCNEYEFFDSDLPSSVACTIGLGGAGGSSDGAAGGVGGTSTFGPFGAAGGGLPTDFGFGEKTRQLRGGRGGSNRNDLPATSGSGHGYANGGTAGKPDGSGNPGGNGNRPTPETLAEYGTGGGGGALRSGAGNGGRGGNGAVPGGPGGGGGGYSAFGVTGNGGNGAPGAIFITSYK